MPELPIRSVAGPSAIPVNRRHEGELRRHIQEFKELIRNLGRPDAKLEQVSWPDLSGGTALSGGSGQGPTLPKPSAEPARFEALGVLDQPGSEQTDHELGEPPLAPSLEPFAVLLGSIGAVDAPPLATESRAAWLPERLAAEIVKSIAWGGDRRRGAARIELGGDRFDGTTVTIEVDGDRLRLGLDTPPGVDAAELRERLTARLERRGLSIEAE